MAGGNSGGIESYLPIAAALAATVATDGAASPWLVESMGATAAGALTSGAAAAAASGLTAAVTNQDVGKSALTGAVTGGIGGALSGYGAAANAGNVGTTAAPLTGSNVAGNAALTPSQIMSGTGFVPTAGSGASFTLPSGLGATSANAMTPEMIKFANSTTDPIGAVNYMANATPAEIQAATGPGAQAASTGSGGIMDFLSRNKGMAALGGTAALGYLMQSGNNKYGTPATETYDGPLSDFNYDRKKYTPLTTAQPNPAYKPVYANYVKNPYNAYAAEGGAVRAMANGGIAMANPSIGPVEQMSRANATGNNQMFPQAAINSPSFATATNRPMAQNIIGSASDTDVDPYTGAQRFAEGGTTEASQAPAAIPLQAMPNFITQNSVNTNNALTQDLVSRLAARNAANPVPGQTPPVNPMQSAGIMAAPTFTRPEVMTTNNMPMGSGGYATEADRANLERLANTPITGGFGGIAQGLARSSLNSLNNAQAPIQQYQGYSTPAFTRPTNIAPIEFQNPGAIVGTKAYNDRIAAEAEAQRQADLAAAAAYAPPSYDGGAGAAGGLMPQDLRYAAGGKIPNHMAAIDKYMAQYQSDPAAVTAKAKAGDYNAMIAINKINNTPNQNYAAGGGVGHLGGYAAGGNPRLLKGPGDGMSDNIPATIGGKQPARLADGEFVVPADVVSHLGNGSTDAGAKHLYAMMDKVRKARTGNKKQGKQIKAEKYLKV
jgi:hypothetical protein